MADIDLEEVGRAVLQQRGYRPTPRGVQPIHQATNAPWVVARRRSDDPSLREYLGEGASGKRPWVTLYNAHTWWSWKEAQKAAELQAEGGVPMKMRAFEMGAQRLIPSSELTIEGLGL